MDKNELVEIRALGSLGYTPETVAIIMGIEKQLFLDQMADGESNVHLQYWGGFYETDARIRKSVFDLAAKGSSPAQAEARRLLDEAETRRFYEQ